MSHIHNTLKQKKLSELASRIRSARRASRLSQAQLAGGIGLSDKSISSYEQGRSIPPLGKLKKIAKTTNHPLTYFMEESGDQATLQQKLILVERELSEIKKLLKKKK